MSGLFLKISLLLLAVNKSIQVRFLNTEATFEAKQFLEDLIISTDIKYCENLQIASTSLEENIVSPVDFSPMRRMLLNVNIDVSKKNSHYVNWNRWHVNVKKFSIVCTMVSMTFKYYTQNILNILKRQLSSKHFPESKRDEDFYVFVKISSKRSGDLDELNRIRRLKFAKSIFVLVEPDNFQVLNVCMLCKPELVFQNVNKNVVSVESVFPKTIKQLHGLELRISLLTGAPSRIGLKKTTNGNFDYERGSLMLFLTDLEKRFNFTTIPFPSMGGGGSGNLQKNGSWNGIMGDIIDAKADLGYVAGETWLRYQYTDMAGAMEFMVLSFARGKQPPEYSWKAVLHPFSTNVWAACSASFLLGFLIMLILNDAKIWSAKKRSKKIELLEFIVSAFFEKASNIPGNLHLRNFATFWSLMGLIMATVYKGIVVSLLAFPFYPHEPNSFDELAASSQYTWGLQFYGGLAYDLFKYSSNPTMQHLASEMELVPDPIKCYNRALKSRFSCITYGTMAEYAILKNFSDRFGNSDLSLARSREFFVPVGPMLSKRSYLLETFRWIIGKTVDSGLSDKWIQMDYENLRRQKFRESKVKSGESYFMELAITHHDILTLKNFKGAFAILFAGSFLSGFMFLSENTLRIFRGRCWWYLVNKSMQLIGQIKR
ncbi:unnamed protein product [Allacma fusca]|uniref:Uncharacterized protein n=1 Tax=Allacma fusca TaxID=39272 RepID=A0A8J2JYD9_9HEXA|nr:unnamed protein product [Allacma fusca]